MKPIAVAILNYNGRDFLSRFLSQVIEHSSDLAEVVVIDNASTDDSVSFLQAEFPQVQLICLTENHGYAGGYNEGLAQLSYDYFVLLNSDIEVTPGWLQPLYEFMEADRVVASVQPKVLSYLRKDHFEHAGAAGGFMDGLAFPFCRGRLITFSEQDQGQYDAEQRVFWTTGACMMVRAQAYREAGGLDADFFAHMEEIDLCWRFQYLGYSLYALPASVVYHVGGGTLAYNNPRKTYLNFRNNLFLIHKNYFDGNLSWYVFKRMVLDGIAAALFLLTGKWGHFKAVFNAHKDYYKAKKTLEQKREEVRSIIRKRELYGQYRFLLVWQFYVRRRKRFSQLIQS